jgi:hypothetical protein
VFPKLGVAVLVTLITMAVMATSASAQVGGPVILGGDDLTAPGATQSSPYGLALDPAAKEQLHGHCCGTMYESMTPYYRTMGRYSRRVNGKRVDRRGKPVSTFEDVDPSVFDRRRRFEPKYDPANLRSFSG